MDKRQIISKEAGLSLKRQCELVGISRSSYYYRKQAEKEENLELIKELDQLERGYLYLTVTDWHSRKVLSWRLSNSLEPRFFREALLEALEEYGESEMGPRGNFV